MVEHFTEGLENYRQPLVDESQSIYHYNQVCNEKFTYGTSKRKSRLCGDVTATIWLGYRYMSLGKLLMQD